MNYAREPSVFTASLPANLVEGGGFEPPKLSRQIYSLIPLATREPLLKRAYILFTPPWVVNHIFRDFQALSAHKVELARGVEPPTG